MTEQLIITDLEKGLHEHLEETLIVGMGCFWGPESRFGSIPGVIRTRVGFAGGTTLNPTYKEMGDHTETVEVVFNPDRITYEDLLRVFWENHYPNRDAYKGRQYLSLLRYKDDEQFAAIQRIQPKMEAALGESIETEVGPFETFTAADERHQKYYLKRYPQALVQLETLFPDQDMLIDSTFAARLNGFVKGFGTTTALTEDIRTWPISGWSQTALIDKLHSLKW